MPRIVAVGWANMDHRFWVPHFPPTSGRTDVSEYKSDIGGPAAVGALTIAHLGGKVAFLGRRGNDEEGLRIKGILDGAGVETGEFRVFHRGRTPVNTVLISPDGERYIFRFMGDALTESPDWIPESIVVGAQGVLVDVRWPEGALK